MAPVVLNVYDLSSYNSYTYLCGIGVFHSGVVVYGVEYAYGGHEYDFSGVFATNPRDAPGQVVFRESIHVGDTDLSPAEVQQLVQRLGEEYKGNRYHLLQRNCNNFASDLCMQLVGHPSPSWINRLAGVAISLHCLLPESWVPPLITPTGLPKGTARDDKESLIVGPLRSDHPRSSVDYPFAERDPNVPAPGTNPLYAPAGVVATSSPAGPPAVSAPPSVRSGGRG